MVQSLLLSIPVIGLAVILQTSILSRINLLSGSADLVLLILAAWGLQERVRNAWLWGLIAGLVLGLVSGAPWFAYPISYILVIFLGRLLSHRVWQAPLLAMFIVTAVGSLVNLLLVYEIRTIFEPPIDFDISFTQVILPSVLLNLLLATVVHALVRRMANRVFPGEEKI
jgi:rod shape-determining protein MreD